MSRLIFGIHPVEQVLRHRWREVTTLFVARKTPPHLLDLARERKIDPTQVSQTELAAITAGGNHQGVALMVGEYNYIDLEDLMEQDATPLLLVADSVTDPQNLGAIIRSGLVLGATGLVIPKDRSATITPAVVRVSAGATEHLPCARVTNLARALDQLRELGVWVAGTVEGGGVHPADADLCGPLALVVGSEHKGIRPLVQKKCDLLLTIPSRSDAIGSLNVAAATATVLYEATRQRRAAPSGAR